MINKTFQKSFEERTTMAEEVFLFLKTWKWQWASRG
jgi:hypothetical protein